MDFRYIEFGRILDKPCRHGSPTWILRDHRRGTAQCVLRKTIHTGIGVDREITTVLFRADQTDFDIRVFNDPVILSAIIMI